jgi:plasmid stabilization system protein ParE
LTEITDDEITDGFPLLAKAPEAGRGRPEIELDLRSFVIDDYVHLLPPAQAGRHRHLPCDSRQARSEKSSFRATEKNG